MELVTDVVNNQLYLYLPVALVLVGAILVFTFGFKSAEQPPFDKLSSISEDKRATSKKRKTKEKKVLNGNAVAVSDKSTKDKQSSNKEAPTTPKQIKTKEPEKKKEVSKPSKTTPFEEQINKKGLKTKSTEKPVDYDDGNWETVPTKNDKKIKKQESPVKKIKKSKKTDEENLPKDDANQTKDDKGIIKKLAAEIIKKEQAKEDFPVIEEKKAKEKIIKDDEQVIAAPAVEKEISKAPIDPVVKEELSNKKIIENESSNEQPPSTGGVAFDELGDVWTDAKAVKKSKKKSRRD